MTSTSTEQQLPQQQLEARHHEQPQPQPQPQPQHATPAVDSHAVPNHDDDAAAAAATGKKKVTPSSRTGTRSASRRDAASARPTDHDVAASSSTPAVAVVVNAAPADDASHATDPVRPTEHDSTTTTTTAAVPDAASSSATTTTAPTTTTTTTTTSTNLTLLVHDLRNVVELGLVFGLLGDPDSGAFYKCRLSGTVAGLLDAVGPALAPRLQVGGTVVLRNVAPQPDRWLQLQPDAIVDAQPASATSLVLRPSELATLAQLLQRPDHKTASVAVHVIGRIVALDDKAEHMRTRDRVRGKLALLDADGIFSGTMEFSSWGGTPEEAQRLFHGITRGAIVEWRNAVLSVPGKGSRFNVELTTPFVNDAMHPVELRELDPNDAATKQRLHQASAGMRARGDRLQQAVLVPAKKQPPQQHEQHADMNHTHVEPQVPADAGTTIVVDAHHRDDDPSGSPAKKARVASTDSAASVAQLFATLNATLVQLQRTLAAYNGAVVPRLRRDDTEIDE